MRRRQLDRCEHSSSSLQRQSSCARIANGLVSLHLQILMMTKTMRTMAMRLRLRQSSPTSVCSTHTRTRSTHHHLRHTTSIAGSSLSFSHTRHIYYTIVCSPLKSDRCGRPLVVDLGGGTDRLASSPHLKRAVCVCHYRYLAALCLHLCQMRGSTHG